MENQQYSSRIIKEKFKTKKFKTRIDLAAMVSVSFLLIIFFLVIVTYRSIGSFRPIHQSFGISTWEIGSVIIVMLCWMAPVYL